MSYKVIDVSYFQGLNINWNTVKSDGVEGAIIRCGQMEGGSPSIDSTFEINYVGVSNAGLHKGSYYTSGANSFDMAQQEANFMVSQLAGKSFDMPIYIDLEDDGDQSFLKANANDVIQIFRNTLGTAGFNLGVYAPYDWFKNYIDVEQWKDIPLWIAQYDVEQVTFTPNYFGMWQYTKTGSVNGVSGNVDIDECYIKYWDREVESIVQSDNDTETISSIDIGIEYEVYIEGKGWSKTSRNGFLAGTTGLGLRLEKVRIRLTNTEDKDIHVAYKLHVQDIGWTEYVYDGAECGQFGKRIEGIQINLTGSYADNVDVNFRSHVQNEGTMNWASDGELSGTEGGELRLEAFAAIVVPQGLDLGIDGIESFEHIVKKTTEEIINDPTYTPIDTGNGYGLYFTDYEAACDCIKGYGISPACDGYPNTQYGKSPGGSPRLFEVLNDARGKIGSPIVLTCVVRCPACNTYWGGVSDSCHLIGDAADSYCTGLDAVEFARFLASNYPDIGVRVYPNQGFVHIEVNTSLCGTGVYNQEGYYYM